MAFDVPLAAFPLADPVAFLVVLAGRFAGDAIDPTLPSPAMVDVRALPPGAPEEHEIARTLAAEAERRDEHPVVGDALWRDLEAPGAGSAGFVAYADHTPIGYLRAIARDAGTRSVDLAMVVHPDHRDGSVAELLVGAGVSYARALPARHVSLWVHGADVHDDGLAARHGLAVERELWQMRVPLPVAARPKWPDRIVLRHFVPGADDEAWLEANNRAFVSDPDQGGWTRDVLQARLAEPWFDPVGFLIADDGGRIAGFCWTKVHPPSPPHEPHPLGEIYVIGVDPDYQGRGLGRALVVAGLDHLHRRGIDVGMLYVDAANTPAVTLYRALGFVTSRVDRAYGRDLP